jgi:putative oxidoreductase
MRKLLDWKGHSVCALAVRLYLGVVFLFACYHKILNPHSFAVDIATYQILPLALVNPMAIILPWVELAAGLMVCVGWRTRAAMLAIGGMLVMFTVAIVMALAAGLDMSCGCFASAGTVDDPISWRTVWREIGWLLLAWYVLLFDRSPLGIDGWRARKRARSTIN